MHLADTFNPLGRFQTLGGFIKSQAPGSPLGHRCHVLLERAFQAFVHIQECRRLRTLILRQFGPTFIELRGSPSRISASSPAVAALLVELSAALGGLRILQNEAWQFASAVAGARDAPSSYHDAAKSLSRTYGSGQKRPRWMSSIPKPIRTAVLEYWQGGGQQLADYRDVDQHHDRLARQCFLDCSAEGYSTFWVRLPDNPESKAPKHYTYGGQIDGIAFASEGFDKIHSLVEALAVQAGATPQPLERAVHFDPELEHIPGVARSTAILLTDAAGTEGLLLGQDEERHVTIRRLVGLTLADDASAAG